MTSKWIPKKADAARVARARKAKALRGERRGTALVKREAGRRADEALEALRQELDRAPRRT